MSVVQDNARDFASRPGSYMEQARWAARREAIEMLVGGPVTTDTVEQIVATANEPDRALHLLVEETNRLCRVSDSTVSLDDAWADFLMACNRHGVG